MVCKKCGAVLSDDEKFCRKCGTATYHNNKNESNEIAKENKANQNLVKDKRFRLKKLVITLFFLLALSIGGLSVLSYLGYLDNPVVENVLEIFKRGNLNEPDHKHEAYSVETRNAEEYFEQNSVVISEVNANESDAVQSEEELNVYLSERGFVDYPITTEYSMDGVYHDETAINASSSEKHPMYQSNFVSASGDLWTIFVVNGVVMANPVFYNMQSDFGVQLIISESESVFSYDGTTNMFYETIPSKSELIVKVVEKIDVETLGSLTIEAIDAL